MRRAHRGAHRRIWQILAVLLPLAAAVAITLRAHAPSPAAPVRIAPP